MSGRGNELSYSIALHCTALHSRHRVAGSAKSYPSLVGLNDEDGLFELVFIQARIEIYQHTMNSAEELRLNARQI